MEEYGKTNPHPLFFYKQNRIYEAVASNRLRDFIEIGLWRFIGKNLYHWIVPNQMETHFREQIFLYYEQDTPIRDFTYQMGFNPNEVTMFRQDELVKQINFVQKNLKRFYDEDHTSLYDYLDMEKLL